jgi:hypothetical protein
MRSLRDACEVFEKSIRERIPKFHPGQLYVKGEAHVLESIRLYNQIQVHHLAELVLSPGLVVTPVASAEILIVT